LLPASATYLIGPPGLPPHKKPGADVHTASRSTIATGWKKSTGRF